MALNKFVGGQRYRVGKKYCVKDNANLCLIFGPLVEGFKTPGVWVTEGGTSETGVSKLEGFGQSDLKDTFQKIFDSHPGLEDFAKGKVKEYQAKGCTYRVEQKSKGSSMTLYHEMTCTTPLN